MNRHVMVIDNASSDDSVIFVKKSFPSIEIIHNKTNLGYAGGNNVGIKRALELGADAVLILNNDTTVEPDFLNHLVERLFADKRNGIVGPKVYMSGTDKIIYSTKSRFIKLLAQPFFIGFKEKDTGKYDQGCETDFIPGSCMLIRRKVLEQMGLFSEDFFLFFEDVEFCLRALKNEFSCIYEPKAVIWHQISASVKFQSPQHLYYLNRNRCYLARRLNHPLAFFFIFCPYFVLKKLIIEACCLIIRGKIRSASAIYRGFFDFLKGIRGKVNYFD